MTYLNETGQTVGYITNWTIFAVFSFVVLIRNIKRKVQKWIMFLAHHTTDQTSYLKYCKKAAYSIDRAIRVVRLSNIPRSVMYHQKYS